MSYYEQQLDTLRSIINHYHVRRYAEFERLLRTYPLDILKDTRIVQRKGFSTLMRIIICRLHEPQLAKILASRGIDPDKLSTNNPNEKLEDLLKIPGYRTAINEKFIAELREIYKRSKEGSSKEETDPTVKKKTMRDLLLDKEESDKIIERLRTGKTKSELQFDSKEKVAAVIQQDEKQSCIDATKVKTKLDSNVFIKQQEPSFEIQQKLYNILLDAALMKYAQHSELRSEIMASLIRMENFQNLRDRINILENI